MFQYEGGLVETLSTQIAGVKKFITHVLPFIYIYKYIYIYVFINVHKKHVELIRKVP